MAGRNQQSKWPWGALFAVVLLLGFEVGVARRDWFWGWVPFSQLGVIDALERQVLTGASPQILLMGSSRVRDAVAPRVLESELRLKEGSVLNLGLTMGTPFDAAILYRRNRDVLRQAKIILFGVEPFQLDANNIPTERVLRYGTLRDRLGLIGRRDAVHLVLGYAWKTLDAGPSLRRLAKSWVVGRPELPPLADDGRVEWRTDADNLRARRRSTTADADRFFRRWKYSSRRETQLRALLAQLAEDGLEVIVFQVPMRDSFWTYARKTYPDEVDAYAEAIARAAADHRLELKWNGTDHGLRAYDFYDYGHLKNRPAARYTKRLARLLERELPETLATIGSVASLPPDATDRPEVSRTGAVQRARRLPSPGLDTPRETRERSPARRRSPPKSNRPTVRKTEPHTKAPAPRAQGSADEVGEVPSAH